MLQINEIDRIFDTMLGGQLCHTVFTIIEKIDGLLSVGPGLANVKRCFNYSWSTRALEAGPPGLEAWFRHNGGV